GGRPASVDSDVAALRPAELLERLAECSDPSLSFRVALGIGHQHANKPHPLGLLRSCRQRPRSRRAAEQRDEVAPFHSITSSAIASRPEGMARSKALAVCRLMTNSNLAACSTGRFFSPLRTRPT